jgi:hypothetical protein
VSIVSGHVVVKCDACQKEYLLALPGRHGYKRKYIEETLEEGGWHVSDGHVCPLCVDDAERDAEVLDFIAAL